MHAPIVSKIAEVHSVVTDGFLRRLVNNLRERRKIEAEIIVACSLRQASELLIKAEDIVRLKAALAEQREEMEPDLLHH